MARYYFGADNSLKCIKGLKAFNIQAAEGSRNVCFAAKINTDYLALPWRIYIDDYVYEDCYMEDKLLEMFGEYVEDIVKGDVISEEEKKFLVEEYGLEEKKEDLTIKK